MFNVRSDVDLLGLGGGQDLSDFRVTLDDPIPRTFGGASGLDSGNFGSQPTISRPAPQRAIDVGAILAANPYLNAIAQPVGNVAMPRPAVPANFLLNGPVRAFDDSGNNNSSGPMSQLQLAADGPYWGSNEPYRHHVCTEAAYSCIEDSPLGERGLKWRADCQAAEDMCNQLLSHSRTNPLGGARDTNILFPNRGYVRIPPDARGEGAYVPPPQRP